MPGGVNFSVYASDAQRVELLLYDDADAATPARRIDLSPAAHRTWHYWHVFVPGLRPGQLYAYAAHGPFDPARGLRFDGYKVLLDPYGRAVALPSAWSRAGGASSDGLDLLLWQAVDQVRLMTGAEPPVAAMRAALQAETRTPGP